MAEQGIVENVSIEAMSHGPDGIGRHGGKVLFIAGGAPGDIVDVGIVRDERRFSRAVIRQIRSPADVRREPRCQYVGRCGGCQWQHLTYAAQLEAKQRNLLDHLQRIGGVAHPPVRPILASPEEWHYRHRINLRVDGKRLGFYRAESHDVVEIASCPIAAAGIELGLFAARRWLAAVETTVRRLALVASEGGRGIVLVANAEGAFAAADDQLNNRIIDAGAATGDEASIRGIVMFGKSWHQTWGDVRVSYAVDGMRLASTGGEFTQVNLDGNLLLVETVLSLGRIRAGHRVLDLFCGAGNLTLPMARRGAAVTGVERSSRAIADARSNAERLGLDCRFVCSPVEQVLSDRRAGVDPPDVVVLDPPRGGAPTVARELARLEIPRIVYVSCDPPTLARDLAILTGRGFRVEVIQPLDLFPHTYHLEAVAALSGPRTT